MMAKVIKNNKNASSYDGRDEDEGPRAHSMH